MVDSGAQVQGQLLHSSTLGRGTLEARWRVATDGSVVLLLIIRVGPRYGAPQLGILGSTHTTWRLGQTTEWSGRPCHSRSHNTWGCRVRLQRPGDVAALLGEQRVDGRPKHVKGVGRRLIATAAATQCQQCCLSADVSRGRWRQRWRTLMGQKSGRRCQCCRSLVGLNSRRC